MNLIYHRSERTQVLQMPSQTNDWMRLLAQGDFVSIEKILKVFDSSRLHEMHHVLRRLLPIGDFVTIERLVTHCMENGLKDDTLIGYGLMAQQQRKPQMNTNVDCRKVMVALQKEKEFFVTNDIRGEKVIQCAIELCKTELVICDEIESIFRNHLSKSHVALPNPFERPQTPAPRESNILFSGLQSVQQCPIKQREDN